MNDQTDPPKLCINCKHFTPEMYPRFLWAKPRPMDFEHAKCAHPSQLDLVSGSATSFCQHVRQGKPCGPDAKLFEPKD
jgi:hypothetical protein